MSLARKFDAGPLPGQAVPEGHGAFALNPAAKRVERWITLLTVAVPFLGLVGALALLWQHGVSRVHLALLGGMYLVTAMGVGMGYHRLITHRAFKTGPMVKTILIVLGSMAAQGPVLFWSAVHRRHHAHSDRPGDPHSPHLHAEGMWETLKGIWHSHTGWLFAPEFTDWGVYIPDLLRDRLVFRLHRLYIVWVTLGLLLPTVIAGFVTRTWIGAFYGLLWGGLVRIFLVHHTTWSINSICHMYGSHTYQVSDWSANNFWLAIPSLGESWHNNHHAFPNSAMHGLEWWQIDITGYMIRVLEMAGLVWDVKRGGGTAKRITQFAGPSQEGSKGP